jgi:hypothetical protein
MNIGQISCTEKSLNEYQHTLRNNPEKQRYGVICFLALSFLHGVRGEFTDDVSETAVGYIMNIPIHDQ